MRPAASCARLHLLQQDRGRCARRAAAGAGRRQRAPRGALRRQQRLGRLAQAACGRPVQRGAPMVVPGQPSAPCLCCADGSVARGYTPCTSRSCKQPSPRTGRLRLPALCCTADCRAPGRGPHLSAGEAPCATSSCTAAAPKAARPGSAAEQAAACSVPAPSQRTPTRAPASSSARAHSKCPARPRRPRCAQARAKALRSRAPCFPLGTQRQVPPCASPSCVQTEVDKRVLSAAIGKQRSQSPAQGERAASSASCSTGSGTPRRVPAPFSSATKSGEQPSSSFSLTSSSRSVSSACCAPHH
jgi:hypothetical protein